MEVGFRKVDGIPAYKMWISRIIGTFIEVGHDLLRQEIRIQPHQRKWDGNNQFPRLHTLNFIKGCMLEGGLSSDACILLFCERRFILTGTSSCRIAGANTVELEIHVS